MADTTSGTFFGVLDQFFKKEQIGNNNLGLYLRNIYKYDEPIDLNSTKQIICGSTVDGTFDAKVKLMPNEQAFPELNIDVDLDVMLCHHMNFLQESNCVKDIPGYPGFVYIIGTPGKDNNCLSHLHYVPNKYNKLCLSGKAIKDLFLPDEDELAKFCFSEDDHQNGFFNVNIDIVLPWLFMAGQISLIAGTLERGIGH